MSTASRAQVRGRNPWRRSLSDRLPAVAPEGVFVSGGFPVTTAWGATSGFCPGLGWSCSVPGGCPQCLLHPPQQGFRHASPSFSMYPPDFSLSVPPLPEFGWNPTYIRGPPPSQGVPPFLQPPPFRDAAASNVPFHRHPQSLPDDYRNWSFAQSQISQDCERFIVLSYNILADYLAMDDRASKLYCHIPRHILGWEWRKRRLLLEFGLWAPDIMCLQEVDHFQDLEKELDSRGYTGIWKMRTGMAVDGCAIFWRMNRFQLRHEEQIEFCKLGLRDNVSQICVLESSLQELDVNASKCLPVSPNFSNGASYVIICNVHILYNPKRGDIKVGQVRVLLDRAYEISREWNDAPVVICGDFNCTPKSPLYNYISDRKLSLHGLARNDASGQRSANVYLPQSYDGSGWNRSNGVPIEDIQEENSDPKFLEKLVGLGLESRFITDFPSTTTSGQVSAYPNLDPWASRKFYNDPYLWTPVEIEAASGNAECTYVEHNLKLRSAYTDVEDYAGTKVMCREPQVTCYNRQFMGTVDYIWYSEGLHTVKVLDTIPKHVLQRNRGFPTQKWGSDHLALVCELAFTGQGGSMGR